MDTIYNILEYIAKGIDILGVGIMLYGFVRSLLRFVSVEIKNTKFSIRFADIQAIRCEIGVYTLLALDFLIASDIVHSILDISNQQLITLVVMIIIRTGIGHFLSKEIKELETSNE
jgi:uncharacterized membrane protein